MQQGKTYEIDRDHTIDYVPLPFDDKVIKFSIDPVSVKRGELVEYSTKITDHEIVGPETEGDIGMRSTQLEVEYRILNNSNRLRKKYRYLNVKEIAPTFFVAKRLVNQKQLEEWRKKNEHRANCENMP